MAGWIDFSALTCTQTVAIWGAVTGTIGTITGILGRYKEEIHQLYCPRLAQNNGFAVITAGLILPFADHDIVVAQRFWEWILSHVSL